MSQKRWVLIYNNPSTDKADTGLQVIDQCGLQSKILYRSARTNPLLAQEEEEKYKRQGKERRGEVGRGESRVRKRGEEDK